MAVICPQCNTENRDVAKFCIECVCTLPTLFGKLDFAATVPAGLKGLRWKSARPAKAAPPDAVLVAGRASAPGAAPACAVSAAERQPAALPKRPAARRRPSPAFCVVALLAGAAGGLIVDEDGPTPRTPVRIAAHAPQDSNSPCFEAAAGSHASCVQPGPPEPVRSRQEIRPLPPAN